MYKERFVQTMDTGEVGDMYYYSYSPYSYTLPSEALLLSLYQEGKSKRNVLLRWPNITGYESFDSTTRPRPQFNDCRHVKSRIAVNLPYAMYVKLKANSYYNYLHYWRRNPLDNGLPQPVVENDFTAAQRRAWHSMQPRFEGKISMLNFLFELKDFKDIMRHAAKPNYRELADELRKLKSKFLREKRKGINGAPFDPTLPAANIRLMYEYAIKPTLRDIADIHQQLATIIDEVQREFQTAGEEEQKSHYTEIIQDVNTCVRAYSSISSYLMKGDLVQSIFTATLSYTYKYTMRTEIDAFMKYWGLQGNFEGLWNAGPFTFLADYFLKIGKAVHMMEHDGNVVLTPSQYCESILQKASHGFFVQGGSSYLSDSHFVVNGKYYNNPTTPVFISGNQSTVFQRLLTSPNKGSALPRFVPPTWGQTVNMLALARCFIK